MNNPAATPDPRSGLPRGESAHCCDARCVCPACSSPMHYAPPTADRAGDRVCSAPDCVFSAGETAAVQELLSRWPASWGRLPDLEVGVATYPGSEHAYLYEERTDAQGLRTRTEVRVDLPWT